MTEGDLSNEEVRLLYVLKIAPGQAWQERIPLSVVNALASEVHILLLTQGRKPANSAERISDNVWVYTATAKHWWRTPFAGLRILKEQLSFTGGFRPTHIIALDPHESAYVAFKAGQKYSCPTQLHILAEVSSSDFTPTENPSRWYRWLAAYLIPKFASVRTEIKRQAESIYERFSISDLEVLPRYQTQPKESNKPKLNLSNAYRPHEVFIYWSGDLSGDSKFYQLLQALRFVLKTPRVALLVHGVGSNSTSVEQAKALGIEQQVIFLPVNASHDDYLRSANLLVVNNTDPKSDELIQQAIAAAVPVVMTETPQRADIFTHGESGFLCPADDVQALTDRIDDLLNDVGLRQQFATQAKQVVKANFYTDLSQYQQAYWQSLSLVSESQSGDSNTSQP